MLRLTLIFFMTAFLFACSDPCDDVNCGTNGSCDDGTCICDDWYEGSNCETETRGKFLGTWTTSNSNCTNAGVDLLPTIDIEGLANIDGIRFRSPDLLSNTWLDATLTDDNTATITPITLGTFEISGSISFVNASSLTLNLTTNVPCTFDLVK